MQKKIDIKSMVLGAVLGAVIVLSIAAAATQTSSDGRFQLAVADGWVFKIDTATGQVWRSLISASNVESFMNANTTVK